jgi:hypothetical protein
MPRYDGVWYQEVMHAGSEGAFAGVEWDPAFARAHLVDQRLWVSRGERVHSFTAANFAIGSAMLRFADREELAGFIDHKADVMRVVMS